MVTTFTSPFYSMNVVNEFGREIDKFFTPTMHNHVKHTAYPPYNVVKVNDDKIVMEFAVAGFSKTEIDVSVEKNTLTIKGEKAGEDEKEYLYKGIAARKFVRSFTLPEYFEVESAGVDNGILYVDIIKNVPEEKKPKTIKIK